MVRFECVLMLKKCTKNACKIPCYARRNIVRLLSALMLKTIKKNACKIP